MISDAYLEADSGNDQTFSVGQSAPVFAPILGTCFDKEMKAMFFVAVRKPLSRFPGLISS
jgi:hypothetical protein